MRKEAGLEVTDRIAVTYQSGDVLNQAVRDHLQFIQDAVLGTSLTAGAPAPDAYTKEWNINGQDAVLALEKQA